MLRLIVQLFIMVYYLNIEKNEYNFTLDGEFQCLFFSNYMNTLGKEKKKRRKREEKEKKKRRK